MDLDKLWQWQKRKLACRVRVETGNPSGDDLRERLAELAKVDLKELLADMKTTKKKKEMLNKTFVDYESEKKFKEVQTRSHIIGASQLALERLEDKDEKGQTATMSRKNPHKRFLLVPSSPPNRVILDIQRERSKPLILPDQDEKNAAAAKIERKLAKQRAARLAVIVQTNREDEAAKTQNSMKATETIDIAKVLSPYKGDLFSTGGAYLESMLYLSRMADSVDKSNRKGGKLPPSEKVDRDKVTKSDAREHQSKTEDVGSQLEESTFSEHGYASDIGAKLYCACSLCSWSRNPANAHRLASEGAVRAIMQLSLEPVPRIAKFCAQAFRLMSEQPPLANSMIEEGAISTILEVIASTSDEFIASNLAIALVNITRLNGKEAQVVEAAIVLGLMNLILIQPDLSSTCARGLYNLTCVDNAYPMIERVIRALVSLSTSGTANVKHICAAALCNLADLRQVRTRIVEEGAVNILGSLARGSETRTRRVCAVILQNLSASKSCRVEMVSRGCVTVAYGLSSDQDPIILRCIGLTLSRLAVEPGNCARIINESGVTALCNIAVKYPTIPGISQPVAAAFQLLSSRHALRTTIVQEGSVTAIATLLRLSVDMFTLQHILLALCNLLSEVDNHLPIVQQGLILTLIALCGQENNVLKDFSALAFLNLSCAEDSRKHLVNSGAIPAIITLCSHESAITQARCAATLCNVSGYSTGMSRMVGDGIIPALVGLVVSDDLATVRYACAALCRISATMENGKLILESGAIPNLVQRALGGDTTTKQFCGAVLSALSIYEACRIKLCEMGVMAAMTSLAELNDDVTKQRCLVAFANISCEESVHKLMVEQGVVSIIARLANSYQEVNYICCAKALCNLGCTKELRVRIAEEHGIHALMMISLVHSVDIDTKLLCAIALSNLLDECTVEYMLQEGIVGSCANLAKIMDERIVNVCVKLFNHLSFYPRGREKICEKFGNMSSLYHLFTSSSSLDTKTICARTAANLVLTHETRAKSIDAGAFAVLERGTLLDDQEAALQCVKAIFSACSESRFLVKLCREKMHMTFGRLALVSSGDKFEYVTKILVMMSWANESRVSLQNGGFASLLMEIIQQCTHNPSFHWLSTTLRYVTLNYPNLGELVKFGITSALMRIYKIDLNEIHDEHKVCKPTPLSNVSFSGKGPQFRPNTPSSPGSSVSLHRPGTAPCQSDFSGSDSVEIIKASAEILRSMCNSSDLFPQLATPDSLTILRRAVDVCGSDPATIYNVAVVIMKFAFSSSECRLATCTGDIIPVMEAMARTASCTELFISALFMYVNDPKCRHVFTNLPIALATVRVFDMNVTEETLDNAITVLHAMTKQASCREMLASPPVNADNCLLRLSLSENPKIKANCSRTLKNLTSDANEAIEEGAVSSLIAISLEGKKAKATDEVFPPPIMHVKFKDTPPPACSSEMIEGACWYDEKVVTIGGAAGKGPEPPEPPQMTDNATNDYALIAEEIDAGEIEGKTKMAFAKMHIPSDLKSRFMLSDADFDLGESSELVLEPVATSAPDSLTLQTAPAELQVSDQAPSPMRPGASTPSKRDAMRTPSGGSEKGKRSNKFERTKSSSPVFGSAGDSGDEGRKSRKGKRSVKERDVSIGEKAAQLGLYA